jgi:predicted nucleic acid-binding protein
VIYLLDTSAIGALMRANTRMASWLSSIGADDRVATCEITRVEILFGLERLSPRRRRTELEAKAGRFFAVLPCEPIPAADGDRYAIVKAAQHAVASRWMRTTSGSLRPPLVIGATLVSTGRLQDSRGACLGGTLRPWLLPQNWLGSAYSRVAPSGIRHSKKGLSCPIARRPRARRQPPAPRSVDSGCGCY